MLISITLISAAIALIEGLSLIKKKMYKELVTLIILLFLAILLVVEKKFNIPTPIVIIKNLLYPLGKIIYRFQ